MTFSWTDFSFQPFTVSAFRFVPVERSALGLLPAGGEFDQALDKMGQPMVRPAVGAPRVAAS
jgi:hypothetical protein